MCIAIVKPKDKTISKETLQTCFENNPDGAGFAYVKDKRIIIYKAMDFNKFYEEYSSHENESNMLIHFRIATHGGVNLDNTHPFKLNDRMVLIHNGVISGYGEKKEGGLSDTRDFINKVIGNISYKMWKSPYFRELVGHAIGGSKLAILDNKGNTIIINKDKGVWDDGVWYSNTSYKPKAIKPVTEDYDYDYYHYGYYTYNRDTSKLTASKAYNKSATTTRDYIEDDCKLLYKCRDCGKIYEVNEYEDAVCDVCKSIKSDEVGFMYDGKRYYYDDEFDKGYQLTLTGVGKEDI